MEGPYQEAVGEDEPRETLSLGRDVKFVYGPMLTMANFICKCNKLRVAFLFIRINSSSLPIATGDLARKQNAAHCAEPIWF